MGISAKSLQSLQSTENSNFSLSNTHCYLSFWFTRNILIHLIPTTPAMLMEFTCSQEWDQVVFSTCPGLGDEMSHLAAPRGSSRGAELGSPMGGTRGGGQTSSSHLLLFNVTLKKPPHPPKKKRPGCKISLWESQSRLLLPPTLHMLWWHP